MVLARKANAEIGDEGPGARNVKRRGDRARIEDRHPADAKATDARGEPERVQGADRRIAARLRHGARAEAVALLGRLVTKDRELDRRIVEARKLKPGVKRRLFAGIGAERVAVGRLEIGPDGRAARVVVDAHEAGRLAIADRRRERRRGRRVRPASPHPALVGAEMADVAPPRQKLAEGCSERGVELGRFAEGIGQFRHRRSFVPNARPVWHNPREAQSAKRIFALRAAAALVNSDAQRSLARRFLGSFANCAVRSSLGKVNSSGTASATTVSRGGRTRDELACAARSPCRARFSAAGCWERVRRVRFNGARGMKPGTPVPTTVLKPDIRLHPVPNLRHGVLGQGRDVKVRLDMVRLGRGGQERRAALHGPGQRNLGGRLVDALRDICDHRVIQELRIQAVSQRGERQENDAVLPTEVEQLPFREDTDGIRPAPRQA